MNALWYWLNWLLTWTYTDVAVIGRWRAGDTWVYTFLVLLLASTILIIVSYGISRGVSRAWKRFFTSKIERPTFRRKRIVRFFLGLYAWWQKKSEKVSTKWGKRIAKTMGRHKYLILFVFNLVPYIPYVSAATIAAAKFKKIPHAIWPIFAGNAVKVFYMVGLIYTSPTWLSWFKDAFSYIVEKIL